MRAGELVKLVGTIAVIFGVLAASAAARSSIEAVERPESAEVSLELVANC